MEQTVRVKGCNADGTAQVVHIRQSACSGDCHQCSGCGAAKQTVVLTAQNPIGARPGQLVTVESASGPVLLAAAVLYLVPIVLFVAGYLLGEHLWTKGPLVGISGFILGLVLARVYDRKAAQKKTVYTITGFAKEPRTGDEES